MGKQATRIRAMVGQHGEVTNNENGAEMLKFLKNNEMKTLNDRVRNPGPEWARQCTRKGESSNVDFLLLVVDVEVVRNRKCMYAQRTKKLQITCLIWTDSQQTRVTKNRCGRKLYRWENV